MSRDRNPQLFSLVALVLLAGSSSCSSSDSSSSGDAGPGIDARASADSPTSAGSADSPTSAGGVDAGQFVNASITLSGDQTGTFDALASGGTDSATGKSTVIVGVATLPTGFNAIGLTVEVNGVLTAKDYATTDFVSGIAGITAPGNKIYLAAIGGTAAGTFGTLHLTSVEMVDQMGTKTTYAIHGSIDVTLEPVPSGATVKLSATF